MAKYSSVDVRVIISIFICFVILIFGIGVVHASEGNQTIQWNNPEAIISGEYFRAIMAAYSDFSKDANPVLAEEKAKKYGENSFPSYSSKLDSYAIIVGTGSRGYTVTFRLRLTYKYPAVLGQGPATTYIIDRESFQIISVDKQK